MDEIIFDARYYGALDIIDSYYINVLLVIAMLLFSKYIYKTSTYKDKFNIVMSIILSIVAISTLVGSINSYFTNKKIVSNCFQNKCYTVTTGAVTHIGHGLGRSKIIINNKTFEIIRNANPFFIDRDIKKITKNDSITIYSMPTHNDDIIYLTRNSTT